MRRTALLAVVTLTGVLAAACVPPPAPSPPAPYLDAVYADLAVTPRAQPITYGAAPAIDPGVGPADPFARPHDGAGNELLRLWVTDPTDNASPLRPAIIWVHGGGFKAGIGAGYGLATDTAAQYARRGYVGFSVEYRVDTTSDCQWVQDNPPTAPGYAEARARCERAIGAAQQDTQAVIRWVRRHAAQYRVDPTKIAVGGFSAGAVTAANVAYRWDASGDHAYSPDDDPRADSRAQATFGASGCEYLPESIGVGDAPASFIASELDQAVDYACVSTTTNTARARGLVAELTSYCDAGGHAKSLYLQHQAATDAQWTTFLARELWIWSGQRPPSTDPTCP
jgi:acetyl esterase/lipase